MLPAPGQIRHASAGAPRPVWGSIMHESTEGFESFVAVVDAGSISAAATALGLPRETLSRRIARLEERLGVRLLHRSSRQLSLSPAGHQLYARARPLVAAAREAEAEVRLLDDVPRGILRVAMPPGPAAAGLSSVFTALLRRWPELRIEAIAATRHVDLIAEGIDVALRGGVVRDLRLVARKLLGASLIAVAAPVYLRARGAPRTASELDQHDLLLGMDAGELPARAWPRLDGPPAPVAGRLVSNDLQLLVAAVRGGHGIALLPELAVRGELAAGELEQVLGGEIGGAAGLWVVWPDRARTPPKVRAFVDHVVDHFRTQGFAGLSGAAAFEVGLGGDPSPS